MKIRMTATLQSGSKVAVRSACGRVQKELGITAQLAMKAILGQLTPAATKIAEKSTRITATLSQMAPTKKFASKAEIATLLKAVDAARQVVSAPMNFKEGALETEKSGIGNDSIIPVDSEAATKQLVLVDASNVARSPGAAPDIRKLAMCRDALILKFPDASIVMVADASLPRLVEQDSEESHNALLKQMISNDQLTIVPPGTPGKADGFILRLAYERSGIVISNDSFREFHDEHPWLSEQGRLLGHTFVPSVGWQFSVRFPVRKRPLPPPPVMTF